MKLLIHDYVGHPFQVELSRELARRGHHVIHAYAGGLITPRGALAKREDDLSGFDSREVPMSPDYRANKYSFVKRRGYEVEYGRTLRALLRETQPEVVISSNTPTEPQCALVREAIRMNVPVITWLQDFYSVGVSKLLAKRLAVLGHLAGAWYRQLDKRCLRASAAVVSITEDFIPLLTAFGVSKENVTVIPNWAPLAEMPLRARENSWGSRHGVNRTFNFLYSGTLAMKHNPELLRQLALQLKNDSDVRVIVISEGPGADYLAHRKAADGLENLILLPFQPFEQMPEVVASADVLMAVLEADAGVFSVPSKVLTYMCGQRPLLGAMPSANLATRTIVAQGAGLTVEPDDVAGFVAAAARLRGDDRLRAEAGLKAREYAEREFDIRRIGDRFEQVIEAARRG